MLLFWRKNNSPFDFVSGGELSLIGRQSGGQRSVAKLQSGVLEAGEQKIEGSDNLVALFLEGADFFAQNMPIDAGQFCR